MKIKLTAFLLTALVSNLSFGQTKLEDLQVDTTITGFHFLADLGGSMAFTKNGAFGEDELDASGSFFIKFAMLELNASVFFIKIEPSITAEVAKEQLDMMVNKSKQTGDKIADLVKKDTVLNGNKAYYTSYVQSDAKANYKSSCFHAFVIKGETIIFFTSTDFDNGKYIDKFRKTFYSLKL